MTEPTEDFIAPIDLRRELGQKLREARRAAGCTQAELARDIGYSRSTVSSAETGYPDVARVFWVSPDDMLETQGILTALYDQLKRAPAARRNGTGR